MYPNFLDMATVYTVTRNEKTAKGLYGLYLCVTIGKDRKYYSLKRYVQPKFWDKDTHSVKGREGNSVFLNNYIRDKEKEVMEVFQYFRIEDKPLTIETFHNYFKKGGPGYFPQFL